MPLLHFAGMPKSAQYLPDIDGVHSDRGVDLDIYACQWCGLVQLDAAPVPYFKEVIRATGFSEAMKAFRRGQFAEWVGKYGLAGKTVLEIGCGRGEYLELLDAAGMMAHGIEFALDAVDACMRRGLRARRSFIDIPDYVHPDGLFDAFAAFNFMEHWPEPNTTLRGIANVLRSDGIGLVEVPNYDMMLRQRLFSEFISDHLCYFTQETLETTLRLNGFEVLECQSIWHDYILSAVVRKRHPSPVEEFESARIALAGEIIGYIAEHSIRGVAIWGAGHQALATIALLGLNNRDIRYVIDSALFKQGRFTPASHLPIVPPDWLERHPVGAVIVMAAGYSEEVARIVREQFPEVPHIAILRENTLARIK